MRAMAAGVLFVSLAMAACDDDQVLVTGEAPAPPDAVQVSYYARAVTVSWELNPLWDGEPFRVYAKRLSDDAYFLIAEVTSCVGGVCYYQDRNVVAGVTYRYYVSAIDPTTGLETASGAVDVFVPQPTPPPVPASLEVIGLDDAVYLKWGSGARAADDFSFYRVYFIGGDGNDYYLGDTDSEGFLDLLAVNGETYTYYVTSVDDQGHESDASFAVSGTPRPDFHGEWVYAYSDQPTLAGFRFQSDESLDPIVDGASADRHFRLEVDAAGWWLVLGPGAAIYTTGFSTTQLKCGVAADAGCVDVTTAPTSGYTTADMSLATQTSYVLRVTGDDGQPHYGVIRIELLGFDQDDNALMIFDWAYQLQPGNPNLMIRRN